MVPDAMLDPRHYACYERIQMPALRMFVEVEQRGIQLDLAALRGFTEVMVKEEEDRYQDLIGGNANHRGVHPDIKRKHLDLKNKNRHGLNFTRDVLLVDHLFEPPYGHEKGMKLKPRLFTPSGPPSTSSKNHLPYFEDEPWVAEFIEWEKMQKLLSTYLGVEGHYYTKTDRWGDDTEIWEEPTGIWQYISEDGCIRPSYLLHRTVTGRTASQKVGLSFSIDNKHKFTRTMAGRKACAVIDSRGFRRLS